MLPYPSAEAMEACIQWYKSPSGQYVMQRMQATVSTMTADVFGYFALEGGVLAGKTSFLGESRITSRYSLGMGNGPTHIAASWEQLPVAFDNIDLFVASHVLECSVEPHQALREIERVLVPEGHVVLIGFNPFSCKGMWRLWQWGKRRQAAPFSLYSTLRVKEWLSVLGFDILETRTLGFRPAALGGGRTFQRMEWLDRLGEKYQFSTGSIYIIHAKKKVSTLTPLGGRLKPASILRPGIAVNTSGIGRVSRQDQQDVK